MLFSVDASKQSLEKYGEFWDLAELTLEQYLKVSAADGVPHILDEDIFGEELFFVRNQSRTAEKKRLDILAIDRNGNGTVIELKKNRGRLGVETQALQYVADVSKYKGQAFATHFGLTKYEDDLHTFLADSGLSIDDLNQTTRIILMARYFDATLFSMGEWLSENNIPFRCVKFEPLTIAGSKYLNFSIAFDNGTQATRHRIEFSQGPREPRSFWHNVGANDKAWWAYLVSHSEISASFDNELEDRGWSALMNYVKGDTVFAYISGVGCVGYGIIDTNATGKEKGYHLAAKESAEDKFPEPGQHLHRRRISWKAVIKDFSRAVSVDELKSRFHINHPIQTSSTIRTGNTTALKQLLEERNETGQQQTVIRRAP